ncbi:universal stress protein [Shinella daejeonensis]|uniref:universal stress protein n=1 Tax=Shinella daejeonensis TaxID=659017 RepID=UPI0020C7BCB5|nr:universal stress protein [Shinella daejeonensis]MCP8894699.1 universal stress protein [Shinella daejeonensis]
MTIKTIIAAIALESGDEPVVRRAIQLAAEHESRLILVHAIESLSASDPDLPTPATVEAIAQVLTADAAASLERLAASADLQAEVRVECGKPDHIIDQLARDANADLLIIGPGKPQNLRERLFGSTADRVVRSSPCPILVVKRETNEPYRSVVAAIDFSPISIAAAQAAAGLAPQAVLELVHALEIPLTFEQAMLKAGTPQLEIDRYRQAKARAAKDGLNSIVTKLSMQGNIRVVRGNAATALVRLARSRKTDLVALGVQGRNAVSKMVLGSVARRVLAASSCDVLLARDTVLPD